MPAALPAPRAQTRIARALRRGYGGRWRTVVAARGIGVPLVIARIVLLNDPQPMRALQLAS